jgi:hypothetical protein
LARQKSTELQIASASETRVGQRDVGARHGSEEVGEPIRGDPGERRARRETES